MECPTCDGDGNVCDDCEENNLSCLRTCETCKKEFCSIPPWVTGVGEEYDCFKRHACVPIQEVKP